MVTRDCFLRLTLGVNFGILKAASPVCTLEMPFVPMVKFYLKLGKLQPGLPIESLMDGVAIEIDIQS